MKRFLISIILLGGTFPIWAQFIQVEGEFRKLPAQGMAIYKDKCFMLNITGHCRVFDIKKTKLISDFRLGCYSSTNHANCASFGVEKIGNCKRPVMYVAECSSPYRCFVENVSDSGSVLVQTIQARNNGKPEVIHDWVVDKKHHFIYGIRTTSEALDSAGTRLTTILKYKLPNLSEGENVVLTETNKIDQYDLYFENVLQGAIIKGNKMYLPVGNLKFKGKESARNRRALIIVDLRKRKIVKKLDINDITNNEPEDCDFYKGKLLLYCGQTGGLYDIPYK